MLHTSFLNELELVCELPARAKLQAGRLAMFLSKSVAHEVMPAYAPRHSFTLWYYGEYRGLFALCVAGLRGVCAFYSDWGLRTMCVEKVTVGP